MVDLALMAQMDCNGGLAARGRSPQAAARRVGLEFVEKLLTTNLTSTDTTERNAACWASRSLYRWSSWRLAWLCVALVVGLVARRRLGSVPEPQRPGTEQASPSSASGSLLRTGGWLRHSA